MNVMLTSIFLFFDMNDLTLNKKKINRYLGEHTRTVKDRTYTREEIKKILDACSLKYKVVIFLWPLVAAGSELFLISDYLL